MQHGPDLMSHSADISQARGCKHVLLVGIRWVGILLGLAPRWCAVPLEWKSWTLLPRHPKGQKAVEWLCPAAAGVYL